MKIKLLIITISILSILSCNPTSTAESPSKTWWQEIPWDGTLIDEKSPSCSNNPDSSNDDFSFFIKEGKIKKMVIYFQGGGACWDYNNCVLIPKYSMEKQIYEKVMFMDMISNQEPLAQQLGYGGIFNFVNNKNPFKDWYFIYIPYCTGDLHAGSNDAVYTEGSTSITIQHRGHINFKWILSWIKDNFHGDSEPEEIFVTGISAGSYGSIFNYTYIKEAFPDSKMFHLGDAGNGIITLNFINSGIVNWNMTIPPALGTIDFSIDLIMDFYAAVANKYIDDTFAQYTTAWDNNQTYYYNVMVNIDTPYNPDGSIKWDDPIPSCCEWNSQLPVYLFDTYSSITADNYRYYIAPGSDHTILMSPKFYDEISNGITLLDWINAMLTKDYSIFQNIECFNNVNDSDCDKPEECTCP